MSLGCSDAVSTRAIMLKLFFLSGMCMHSGLFGAVVMKFSFACDWDAHAAAMRESFFPSLVCVGALISWCRGSC